MRKFFGWWCGLLLLGVGANGAEIPIENFSAGAAPQVLEAQKRTMTLTIETAPSGLSTNGLAPDISAAPKALRWQWTAQPVAFNEAYYTKDYPTFGAAPDGILTAKIYAEKPAGIWSLGFRLRDGKGEMFDFAINLAKLNFPAAQWMTISLPIKSGAQSSSWGDGKNGVLTGNVALAGYSLYLDEKIAAGDFFMTDLIFTAEKPAVGADTPKYDLAAAELLQPFWRSATIRGEAAFFVRETDAAAPTAFLQFTPRKIIRVWDPRSGKVFEAGKDFTVNGREISLTANSPIPFLPREKLYREPKGEHAIKAKVGDPQTWIYYEESGYCRYQIEIDYERAEDYSGFAPTFAGEILPRVTGKLQRGEPVRIAIIGDSISTGPNASNRVPPYMPGYHELVRRQLAATYQSEITLTNLAIGGTNSEQGKEQITAAARSQPDLLLIAFGGNDLAARNPTWFGNNIRAIIDGVRAARPAVEIILLSEGLTNPEWDWAPVEEFPRYREALKTLTGAGIALADVTAIYEEARRHKRYYDFTGNGVNHPNDYGHRLYAQTLLGMLVK